MALGSPAQPLAAMSAGLSPRKPIPSSTSNGQAMSMSPPPPLVDQHAVSTRASPQARMTMQAGPSASPAPQSGQNGLASRDAATPKPGSTSAAQDRPASPSTSQGQEEDKKASGSVVPEEQRKPIPPQQRLPPTIDPTLIHQSLCARQAYFDSLLADQRSALKPDYKTPFKSAHDVVKRLMPYHVYNVNEGDLFHILGKGLGEVSSSLHHEVAGDAASGEVEVGAASISKALTPRQAAKRRRIDYLDAIPNAFPTDGEAERFFNRYADVHARARRLRNTLVDTVQRDFNAPFAQESTIILERSALESEREQYAIEQETFRKEKERAAAAGVSWDELMRINALGRDTGTGAEDSAESESESDSGESRSSSSDAETASQARQSPQARRGRGTHSPATPQRGRGGIKRGRGRPRKTEEGRSAPVRAPSSKSPGTVVNGALPQAAAPPGHAAPRAIPQHPISLIIPLAALPRLSDIGITPVPAAHLLPAIRARQAAQEQGIGPAADGAFARYNTAPRPAPPDQQEPALLLGITIGREIVPGRSGATGGSGAATGEEMLHISVILPKFDAPRLSGLAQLMTSLQHMQPGTLPVPSDPRGNTAVGAVVAAYVAGGVNVPTANAVMVQQQQQAQMQQRQQQQQQQQHQGAASVTGPASSSLGAEATAAVPSAPGYMQKASNADAGVQAPTAGTQQATPDVVPDIDNDMSQV